MPVHLKKTMTDRRIVAHIENLEHVYPSGVHALKNINLDFYAGQITAIVGQNGSGKTTISKHFNGLLRPTSGRIEINGRDVAGRRVSEMALEVGYVFQNPSYQLFCASVKEEVRFGLKNLKLKDEEVKSRSRQIMEKFDIWNIRNMQPVSLSSGSKKIVALASVYAMDPGILFLDEPTTGQDQAGKTRLGLLAREMKAAGKTIIIISHDMDFVAEYAERVIVMNEGEVLLDGSVDEVFTRKDIMKKAHLMPPQYYRIVNHLHIPTDGSRMTNDKIARYLVQEGYFDE